MHATITYSQLPPATPISTNKSEYRYFANLFGNENQRALLKDIHADLNLAKTKS
jgi:hypothetical protein